MESGAVESRRVEVTADDGRGRDADMEVRYFVAGEGPPVVLLHGLGLDAATVSWRHVLPALAGEYRVYAPDLPGHGGSEKPTARYTTAFFRRAFEAFRTELGLESVRLVGLSMGGAVALGHALEGDVERLVLVDSYGLGEDAPWRAGAATLLRAPFLQRLWWTGLGASRRTVRSHLRGVVAGRPPADLVEDVYAAVQDADVGRTTGSWQRSEFRAGGFETCYLDRLGGLEAPTLLVHGGADPLLPPSWSRRATDRIDDSRLCVFERCGHWPPRERPEEFTRALQSFL